MAAAAAAAAHGNAVLARGARALVAAARQHLGALAAELAEQEAAVEAAEAAAAAAGEGGGEVRGSGGPPLRLPLRLLLCLVAIFCRSQNSGLPHCCGHTSG